MITQRPAAPPDAACCLPAAPPDTNRQLHMPARPLHMAARRPPAPPHRARNGGALLLLERQRGAPVAGACRAEPRR